MMFRAIVLILLLGLPLERVAAQWPRWRGDNGGGVLAEARFPSRWNRQLNVVWQTKIDGEGYSSPIVHGQDVFLTSASDFGQQRHVFCLRLRDGKVRWKKTIADKNPEITSAITGHAASTPVTNGKVVAAFFGNAGLVCYDRNGNRQWRKRFGEFESELGLASSPVMVGNLVVQVCDHDGTRFQTFDSFLLAVDAKTGKQRWKVTRPRLFRSWSTPIVVPDGKERHLIVNAQDELRAYDASTGKQRWKVTGTTGWVTPSPVFAGGKIFSTSGKNGPTFAIRPGGRGDVSRSHVAWKIPRGGPYVCSPIALGKFVYLLTEIGILKCLDASTGKVVYEKRLKGKFTASPVACRRMLLLCNDKGVVHVVRPGPQFELLASNDMGESILASPALTLRHLLIRTETTLFCISSQRQD